MKMFFLLSFLLFSGLSKAHLRNRSYSEWNLEGDRVKVFFTVNARFVTKLPLIDPLEKSVGQQLSGHLRNNLWVKKGDKVCSLSEFPLSFPLEGGSFYSTFTFYCPGQSKKFSLFFNAFFNVSPSHLHFAEINFMGKKEQVLFSKTKREWKTDLKKAVKINVLKNGKILALLFGLIFLGRGLKMTSFLVIFFLAGYVMPSVGAEVFTSLIAVLVFAESVRQRNNMNPLIYQILAIFIVFLSFFMNEYPPIFFIGMALFTSCYGFSKKKDFSWPALSFLFGLTYGLG